MTPKDILLLGFSFFINIVVLFTFYITFWGIYISSHILFGGTVEELENNWIIIPFTIMFGTTSLVIMMSLNKILNRLK